MRTYIARRLIGGVFVLWLVSVLVFLMVRALPGDAVMAQLGEAGRLSDEQMAAAREQLGLNDPVLVSYLKWAGGYLRADMGQSVVQLGVPVSERIFKALVPTVQLALMSGAIGIPLSVGLGMLSGVRQDTWVDYPLRMVAVLALSIPNFVLATLVMVFLSRQFSYAPPFGWVDPWVDPWRNLQVIYLPVLISGLTVSGVIMRMSRSAVIEVMRQDYVRTARAKGLTAWSVTMRHIVRNSLISVTTLMGLAVIGMLSGSVIMEVLFSLPGVGRLTLTAIQQRDYTQIMGNTMFYASVVIGANLAVDLLYGVIDPRVKHT